MAYSEHFVRRCLELAKYDLSCSLAELINLADPEDRDFRTLIAGLPEAGKDWLRQPPFTDEQLQAIEVGDAALRMLDYGVAYAGDTDIVVPPGQIRVHRPENVATRIAVAGFQRPGSTQKTNRPRFLWSPWLIGSRGADQEKTSREHGPT